jgi:hypothetical protein
VESVLPVTSDEEPTSFNLLKGFFRNDIVANELIISRGYLA